MAILSNPAFGPKMSITYITVGTLIDVWVGVWYYAFIRPEPGPIDQTTFFWMTGLFLTGLTLVVIGLFIGPIGRQARRAELPPAGYATKEAEIQQTAAATAQPMVAAVPNAQGQVPVAGQPVGNPLNPVVVTNQAAPPSSTSLPTALKV